jgi:hypothetical protein
MGIGQRAERLAGGGHPGTDAQRAEANVQNGGLCFRPAAIRRPALSGADVQTNPKQEFQPRALPLAQG